jgi:hypothetical protein
MQFERIYRHGDVLLFKLQNNLPPTEAQKNVVNELTLELGEVTGHAHRLKGAITIWKTQQDRERELLFEVADKAILTHEEHDTIVLEKGFYLKVSQVEYNPFTEMTTYVRD